MSWCFIAKGKSFDLGWEGGGDRTEKNEVSYFVIQEIFFH